MTPSPRLRPLEVALPDAAAGGAIPAPRDFESLKRDPEFAEDSADAIVTMVAPKGVMAAAE